MNDTTQTVVDKTDVTAKPVTEVTDTARDDVDALDKYLAEFDQTTKTTTTQTTQTTQPQIDPAIEARLRQVETVALENRRVEDRRAMTQTIEEIRGDLPKDVFDDLMVEGWLNALAMQNPKLTEAYLQREQNPRAWGKVKAELGKKLHDRFNKLPNREATDDREAVAQAVRGASTKVTTEPPPKLGQMSNSEYRKYVRETHGYDPGV